MAPTDPTPHLALAPVAALVVVLMQMALTGCGPVEGVDPTAAPPASASTPVVTTPATASGPAAVAFDADPHDGVIGDVTLTPAQVAYRDLLDLTDAETHDAFRYSCAIPDSPTSFVRYANVPPTTEESP